MNTWIDQTWHNLSPDVCRWWADAETFFPIQASYTYGYMELIAVVEAFNLCMDR